MDCIYAIPTHRPMLEKNVNDYFEEVSYAKKTFSKRVLLAFFEDSENYINKELINNISKKFPDIDYMYINRDDTRKVYDLIYEKLSFQAKKIFLKLYPNKNVNYGNIFNRIFIFALILKCDYICRRDSDVLIEEQNGEKIYPIKNELAFLGNQDKTNGKIIYICGGGYKETYNLDIESLIKSNGKDYSLVRKLFTCMSIPKEHHDDIINEEILNNNLPFKYDEIDFDSRAYPECGNVGIYKIYKYFPSASQDFILGSDYFFIDVSVHSKLDVVYHNRAVIHRHTKDRKQEYNKVYNYWKGFLMLIDSQVFYREFYEKYLDDKDFNDFTLINENVKQLINNMNKELIDNFVKNKTKRIIKLDECLNVLGESYDNQIREISKSLKNEYDFIIEFTNQSIKDHIDLIENWNEISTVASGISDITEIKELISNKLVEGNSYE